MAGVRDLLVLLPLPRAATLTTAFLDFLHPCESKNAVGSVAGSCLNLAGGCMGDGQGGPNLVFDFGRIRIQRAQVLSALGSYCQR